MIIWKSFSREKESRAIVDVFIADDENEDNNYGREDDVGEIVLLP